MKNVSYLITDQKKNDMTVVTSRAGNSYKKKICSHFADNCCFRHSVQYIGSCVRVHIFIEDDQSDEGDIRCHVQG